MLENTEDGISNTNLELENFYEFWGIIYKIFKISY